MRYKTTPNDEASHCVLLYHINCDTHCKCTYSTILLILQVLRSLERKVLSCLSFCVSLSNSQVTSRVTLYLFPLHFWLSNDPERVAPIRLRVPIVGTHRPAARVSSHLLGCFMASAWGISRMEAIFLSICLSVCLCETLFLSPKSPQARLSHFFSFKRSRTIAPHTATRTDSRHADRRIAPIPTFSGALWLQHRVFGTNQITTPSILCPAFKPIRTNRCICQVVNSEHHYNTISFYLRALYLSARGQHMNGHSSNNSAIIGYATGER